MVPISLADPENCEIILAGDPLQLSPIVLSTHAKDRGLSYSMLERYIDRYGTIKTVEMVSSSVFPMIFHFPSLFFSRIIHFWLYNLQKDGDDFDPRLVTKLIKNYRALPSILKFYSDTFYKSSLVDTKNHNESKYLEYIYRFMFQTERKPFGIRFHDVKGTNYRERGRRSWHNPIESRMVR